MLTNAGAKLLDFGLAKSDTGAAAGSHLSAVPTPPPNLTAQGTILGTFQYMAPEQAEGRPLDARADVFSFGAVLYEMVSGSRAFRGTSLAEILSAVLRDDPRPFQAPRAVEQIVTRPIEQVLLGTPQTTAVRSTSSPGLAVITVFFEDNVDVYRARQLVTSGQIAPVR